MITDDTVEDLNAFETPDEAFQYLRYAGGLNDDALDVGETALALALVSMPVINPDRYRNHLRKLGDQVHEEFANRQRQGAADTLAVRVSTIQKILHDMNGYKGDDKTYDDIQNANMIRVIDRRAGLPVALGILYIAVARRMGWEAFGLKFPGHFLVRFDLDGARVIVDPFLGGTEMDAAALRQLLKSVVGQSAELSHDYYTPVSARDMLVRLQNNLKKRLIDLEDYAQAVIVLESMEALAPGEYRTLFDKGILYAKLGQVGQAKTALEGYIARTPDARERQQAQAILQQIIATQR